MIGWLRKRSLPARVLAYDAVAIVVFENMVTRRRCKLGQHFCAFKVQFRAMHLTRVTRFTYICEASSGTRFGIWHGASRHPRGAGYEAEALMEGSQGMTDE